MDGARPHEHPKAYEPGTLAMNVLTSLLGAIIGLELITRVGITPNTSIIGALIAIGIGLIPVGALSAFRNIHRQNLVQTAISAATFTAANVVLLAIGVPWLLGYRDLVIPFLIGVIVAAFVDVTTAYWIFDSDVYPASNPWPPGIATAEAIKAAAERGKRALLLLYGGIAGAFLRYFGVPADIIGIAFIANTWAITMFGIGLILRGYSIQIFGFDINKLYVPHGIMIGAGIASLIQLALIVRKASRERREQKVSEAEVGRPTVPPELLKKRILMSYGLFTAGAVVVALACGLYLAMPPAQLLLWVLYAGFMAIFTTLIVGISAMHAGWFPAFATALIALVVGLLLGFPPVAAGLLVGYVAATGPTFADIAYDLKTGWILRGYGRDVEFELRGRRQQYIAEVTGIIVGIAMAAAFHQLYFTQNLFPPVDRVYVATIKAGVNPEIARNLALWSVVGFIIQLAGGPARQIGILFATGLLIKYPIAGITTLVAIAVRVALERIYGVKRVSDVMYVVGAGLIAGSALTSFFTQTLRALAKK